MQPFLHSVITILTNLFIVLMLFWMIFWDRELSHPVRKWWIPKVLPYFFWLGLCHEWKMFSPDPYKQNWWPKIKLTLADGNFFIWEPTPSEQLNAWEKLRYKKYHKLYLEISRYKGAVNIKLDFILYLLRRYNLEGTCVKAEIYQVHQPIPPMDNSEQTPVKTYQSLVYTYQPVKS
ncbi:hypothetical protein [Deminuibacter soli]|uniref:Uncharacterized protein n=1 Tax=Deminuibacter soli TaxID=2291815 RepID=A0A3E1NEY9_9BACT|nr:hypothetical protein [Deminuibacter soli]RFM26432.1 hypothetical protein DXN05_19575 [Deminuibacter soli]